MKVIYLDNNATTSLDPSLLEDKDIQEILHNPLNPSSLHYWGRIAKNQLLKARKSICSYLDVPLESILFTSGATEGLNFCIKGLSENFTHIISSKIEHPAVLKSLLHLQKRGCTLTLLDPGEKGYIAEEDLQNALQEDTSLIVLSYANSETGIKNPITDIATIAQEKKIPFIVDGVAWLGKDTMQIPAGVSAICFSGHKIHAFEGSGFVYLDPSLVIEPLLFGGPQEYQKRAGTQNLLGAVSLGKMVEKLKKNEIESIHHMQSLRDFFEASLLKECCDMAINGTGTRICNTTNIHFPEMDAEVLFKDLDTLGVCASLGSACSSGSIEPSKVLLAMGYPKKRALESLRFSFSRMNTQEEVEEAISLLLQAIQKQKSLLVK